MKSIITAIILIGLIMPVNAGITDEVRAAERKIREKGKAYAFFQVNDNLCNGGLQRKTVERHRKKLQKYAKSKKQSERYLVVAFDNMVKTLHRRFSLRLAGPDKIEFCRLVRLEMKEVRNGNFGINI